MRVVFSHYFIALYLILVSFWENINYKEKAKPNVLAVTFTEEVKVLFFNPD